MMSLFERIRASLDLAASRALPVSVIFGHRFGVFIIGLLLRMPVPPDRVRGEV